MRPDGNNEILQPTGAPGAKWTRLIASVVRSSTCHVNTAARSTRRESHRRGRCRMARSTRLTAAWCRSQSGGWLDVVAFHGMTIPPFPRSATLATTYRLQPPVDTAAKIGAPCVLRLSMLETA